MLKTSHVLRSSEFCLLHFVWVLNGQQRCSWRCWQATLQIQRARAKHRCWTRHAHPMRSVDGANCLSNSKQDVFSNAWNDKTDPVLCPYFCLAATCLLGNDTRSAWGNLFLIKFKSLYMFGGILGLNAKNATRKPVWATHATLVFQTILKHKLAFFAKCFEMRSAASSLDCRARSL